jgi:hypothetical protein
LGWESVMPKIHYEFVKGPALDNWLADQMAKDVKHRMGRVTRTPIKQLLWWLAGATD